LVLLSLCAACGTLSAALGIDVTPEIPEITIDHSLTYRFNKIPNVAQYKHADWSHVVGIAKGISLTEAYRIADANPEITFFFYTKGDQMVLETGDDLSYRVFRHGDTVFFSGEPWWGSATDLADGYTKNQQ